MGTFQRAKYAIQVNAPAGRTHTAGRISRPAAISLEDFYGAVLSGLHPDAQPLG